jgi:2-polyprenyl-6-methoxyphenol hydroxylase-like FAD-dependent oxidoreductase
MSDYDVVVVGASIAGCTAATFLGRAGARVALVESHSDPKTFKRMCTHFIQPSASPTIERLGLTGAIERAGGRRNDLNIWTKYGWISHAREWSEPPMRDHPAWNIRRETLDPIVREHAAATDGVTLMLGHTATAISRGAGTGAGRVSGVSVRERDGSERELRAKLVIAADGRDSQIGKLSGIPTKQKPNNRFGYFAHYRETPLVTGDSAQMWLLNPDVAYAFPTDGELTLLTCMPHKDRVAEFKSDPEQAMVKLFERLPDGPRLDPAKRESKVMGKLDMPNSMRPASSPGLAFVGDAALAADPLWGVGCGWALQSAEWLADAVGPALMGGDAEVDSALEAYARRHRKGLAAHEKLCSDYSRGRKFNPLEKMLYRAAARDRTIAERMAQMGGRWIRPQEMLTPGTLARIARVNLSPRSSQNGLRTQPPVASPVSVAAAG